MTEKIVVLDPGHGGWDPGKPAADGRYEKTFTLELGLKVRDLLLAQYAVRVKMTREDDRALGGTVRADLAARANVANNLGAHLLFSLHGNGHGTPDAYGGELFTYTQREGTPPPIPEEAPHSYRLAVRAEPVLVETLRSLGIRWRGLKSQDLGVLRNTNGPSMLFEPFFLSTPADLAKVWTPSGMPKLAAGIARAIAVALELPAREGAPGNPGLRTLYAVQVGAFKSKENALRQQQRLADAGFGNSILVLKEVNGLEVWAVQLGAFSIRAGAEQLRDQVRAKGFAAIIVEKQVRARGTSAPTGDLLPAAGGSDLPQVVVTRTLHAVQVGAFKIRENAVRRQQQLAEAGFAESILVAREVRGAQVWAVQLGAFANRAGAERLLEQVKAAGFPGFIIERTVSDEGHPAPVWTWPVDNPAMSQISSRFGDRDKERGYVPHKGLDIAQPPGNPIRAARPGVVVSAGWLGGYGNCVILEHEEGLRTLYAHASQLLVGAGRRVEQGELIARIGTSGNSTGPHLHFEVQVAGKAQDPLQFLPPL